MSNRGGGLGDLLVTLFLIDVCVRPCVQGVVHATCAGCWLRSQPYPNNYPNRWYSGPPVAPPSTVVTPGGAVVVTRETAGDWPPLDALDMRRD